MDVSLRSVTQEDYEFLWWLHCNTIRPYVEQTWGWDEAWQRQHFRERFEPEKREIVEAGGIPIGCVSLEHREDQIFLALIEIAPDYQGQGIGTELIRGLLDESDRRGVPIELRVLRANPARRLYERLGFAVVQETDTHYAMRRSPFDGSEAEQDVHDM